MIRLEQMEADLHVLVTSEHSYISRWIDENRADLVPCDVGGAKAVHRTFTYEGHPCAVAVQLWHLRETPLAGREGQQPDHGCPRVLACIVS
jgi:hypothetical protein